MIRYLHMQAQSIVQHFAVKMYNTGTYSFLPDKTVPLLDDDPDNDKYKTHPHHSRISLHMGVTLDPMCPPRGAQRRAASQDHELAHPTGLKTGDQRK
jgi:hypothetical protein